MQDPADEISIQELKNDHGAAGIPQCRFHLAVGVDDLAAAEHFYGQIVGCSRGRQSQRWIDWNFFGHQLVTHLTDCPSPQSGVEGDTEKPNPTKAHNAVDGFQVPVPHFGALLSIDDFNELAERFRAAQVEFKIEPYVRFAGKAGEQHTMFVLDPAGNALEFKAFAFDEMVFATS